MDELNYIGKLYYLTYTFLLPLDKKEVSTSKQLGNITIKEANECFKIECAICNSKFKNWEVEKNLNYIKWKQGNYYYIIELCSLPLYSINIDKGLTKVKNEKIVKI